MTGDRHGAHATTRTWELPHPGELVARNRHLVAVLAGLATAAFALFVYQDSALALPLLVAGMALVALGLFGPRFAGRVALEWGPGGVDLEVRTGLRPRGRSQTVEEHPHLALPEADPPGELIVVRRAAEPASPPRP